MSDGYDEPDEDFDSLQCFRCDRLMPPPAEGQKVAAGWALDVDGDVVYCPEHVPGPPHGWRDMVTTYTADQLRKERVDPAKVPEKFRHLFE